MWVTSGALLVVGLFTAAPAAAAPFAVFLESGLPVPAGPNAAAGTSIALSADGTRAVVGAPGLDGIGSAHVFVRAGSGWAYEASLRGSLARAGSRFGAAVAISADGTRVLVGAPDSAASDPGGAFVFVRAGTSWTEEHWFQNFRGGDLFGAAVALSADGTRAIIGAPDDDPPGFSTGDEGSFTTFDRSGSTWASGPVTFTADRMAGDGCGTAVAISGDGLVVALGCPLDDDGGAQAGSVTFFDWDGAAWVAFATRHGASAGEVFGSAVDLSGDGAWALVGAPKNDARSGSAFVLSRSPTSFDVAATLLPLAGGAPDRFGWAVALSSDGTRAIVGSARSAMFAGGGFLYQRESATWSERAAVVDATPQTNDRMCASVALSGDGSRAACGVPGDGTSDAGSAVVYALSAEPGIACVDGSYCTSGFCVEGVCCDAACGDGASTDCQSCRAALTGGLDGVCLGLSAAIAPTVICRAAAGGCDVPEACVAADRVCPADAMAAGGAVCRPSVDGCDAEERCSGTSVDCAADALQPIGYVCRPPRGPCDAPETCDGISAGCSADVLWDASHVCSASGGGACDVDDVCTGDSAECPARFLVGVECRPSAGACDPPETCSSSADCPADQHAPAGTVCRASMDLECDPLESCDGFAASCPAEENRCTYDGSVGGDAGPADAGAVSAATGCACRHSASSPSTIPAWSIALLLLLRRARR